MKKGAVEGAAVRTFLRVRADGKDKREEQKSRRPSGTQHGAIAGHIRAVAIVGALGRWNKGT
jgi:hypothetical protein